MLQIFKGKTHKGSDCAEEGLDDQICAFFDFASPDCRQCQAMIDISQFQSIVFVMHLWGNVPSVPIGFGNLIFRDKILHRGLCPSGTRIWVRILGKRILDGRILDSNYWVESFDPIFSAKEAPRKIHPQDIHLQKFTFQLSTQKSGKQNSHFTSAGPSGWVICGKLFFYLQLEPFLLTVASLLTVR